MRRREDEIFAIQERVGLTEQGLLMREKPWILVVDDDQAILEMLQALLSQDYLVDPVTNVREAQKHLQARAYDLVLTDMVMPELGGMELLKYLRLHYPEMPVIVFTGYANFQEAVTAVKLGALDYLTKPIQIEILRHTLGRALEFRRLAKAQKDLEAIFQGAEALGWQALELISGTPEAAILSSLKEAADEPRLEVVGRRFLMGALQLVQASRSSIFLFSPKLDQLTGLCSLGPQSEERSRVSMGITDGIMGYVASQRRPLLVPDITRDHRFAVQPGGRNYLTDSFMIIPLVGKRFWGVINLADREDGKPFSARDLFLGWLLGRLLVEILESREDREGEAIPAMENLVHEHMPIGLALLGEDLRVIQANATLGRLLGLKTSSLVGEEIIPRLGVSPGEQEMVKEAFQKLLASKEQQQLPSLKSVINQKGIRFLGVKMFPSMINPESPQGFLLVEDVTEREQLKQRLHLYEHLAIMGKLSLCVAHELNNPLDGIRRYVSLAQRKKTEPEEVERYLSEALKGLQRMSLTINSLLSSANPIKAPRTADNLLNLLQDAVKIMMFQASDQRVEVLFHSSQELRGVRVEGDIYHVFINVIKNALQAMPHGGSLRILGAVNPEGIDISFSDTGPGLSSEELANVFQPFYTTKTGEQGLGLGLPICRKILERYGGRLEGASEVGTGTTIRVILPKSIMGGSLAA